MSVVAVAMLAATLFGRVQLQDDPPVAARPKAGTITGRITPAEMVKTIRAVSRADGKGFLPDEFDKKTGRFRFQKMPGATAYDICITTTDGRDYEGIDLDFAGARLAQLAEMRRKKLALPAKKKPEKFLAEDVRAIEKFVADWQDFLDTRRILYISGQGNRAVVLIELMRTREFHKSRKPRSKDSELIWRIELWYLARQSGGWERLPNTERLLRRARMVPRDWQQKIAVEYYPQLTARLDAAGQSKPIRFTIPSKPDPTRGRPARTKIKLQTRPHVLGLGK